MSYSDQPYSGQPCQQPGCDGILRVESTKVQGENRRRYFKCNKCGVSPENNVQSVPLRYAPPRVRHVKVDRPAAPLRTFVVPPSGGETG